MQDDEIALFNSCTDLVSLKRWEAFPLRILSGKRPGEWVRVGEVCKQIGIPAGDLTPDLFVTWLPDPAGQDGYAVILFYDDESKWSLAAHYNHRRLIGERPADETLSVTGVAIPAPAVSLSQPPSSAAKR